MVELFFLGAGGGRFQTVDQTFKTGGFRLHAGVKVHVDPGPGALLLTHQYGLNPLDLDAVIVSHCHPDHYADAEVLVEAMAQHMTKKRGIVIASKSVIESTADFGPAISKYHLGKTEKWTVLKPGENYQLENVTIEAVPAQHSDPTAIGLIFHTQNGDIGYTGDTHYFEGISKQFKGVRVLIANVTRPLSMWIPWHLCSEDLVAMLKEVKPELAVMTHMGMLFLRHPPNNEAARITAESGVTTIPGYAGTKVTIDDKVKIIRPTKQPSLEEFSARKTEDTNARD